MPGANSKATKSLETYGPDAFFNLERISDKIRDAIHGPKLVTGGNVFKIQYRNEDEFKNSLPWIQVAVAYSRIIVDEEARRSGISKDTKLTLCNAFSIAKWIPMRSDTPVKIKLSEDDKAERKNVKTTKKLVDDRQISIEEALRNG